jgi:hypothetical protein
MSISNKYFYFFLIIIILIYISSRLFLLPSHFANQDDSAVGHIIWTVNAYNSSEIKSKLAEYNKDFFFIIFIIDNFPSLLPFIKFLLTPLGISQNTSYAPLQFFQTAIFANFDNSYLTSLFSVRFSSFLNSLFAMFFIFLFFKKLEKKDYKILIITSFLIITLSWMYLIYSSLAMNTGSIVLVSSILLYLLLKLDLFNLNFKISLLLGVLITFLILIHYQTIIFLPGFYLALFYLTDLKLKVFLKKIGPCILVNIVTFIIIYFYYLIRIKTVHWNTGQNLEYLFNYKILSQNLFDILNYFFIFFFKNIFLTIQSIFSFTDISGILSKIYTSIIIFFSLFAIFFFEKRKEVISILIFILITFIFWFILIILQKLTLSPTRHSLFILIPLCYLASYGFFLFLKSIKFNFIKTKIKPFFFFSLICVFFLYIDNYFIEKTKREDPFQIINYEEILKKYNVTNIITYNATPYQYYFPYVNKSFFHKAGPYNTLIYYKKDNNLQNQHVAFVSTVHYPITNNFEHNFYNFIINFIFSDKFKDLKKLDNYQNIDDISKNYSIEKKIEQIFEYKNLSDTGVEYGILSNLGKNHLKINIFKVY